MLAAVADDFPPKHAEASGLGMTLGVVEEGAVIAEVNPKVSVCVCVCVCTRARARSSARLCERVCALIITTATPRDHSPVTRGSASASAATSTPKQVKAQSIIWA